jgi:hypothetical protein
VFYLIIPAVILENNRIATIQEIELFLETGFLIIFIEEDKRFNPKIVVSNYFVTI